MWVTQGSPFQCERRDRLVALSGRTKDRAELQHPRKGETHPRHTPLVSLYIVKESSNS